MRYSGVLHVAATCFIVSYLPAIFLASAVSPSFAQWSTNPNVNNAISTAANDQKAPTIVSDGAGGAIIMWSDYRGGTHYDIYAQRINSAGVVQWIANGVAISTAANTQRKSTIVSDGSGGAIISWEDYRSGVDYDIYAQQVSAGGILGQVTSVGEQEGVIARLALFQNYPNPFNPTTTIKFEIPNSSMVKITVYDILGREVSRPVEQSLEAGRYMLNFDASALSSGTYFYRINAGVFTDVKKMTVVK